jgi:hypothetical protein
VITISKQLDQTDCGYPRPLSFRGRKQWFGYPVQFRRKEDREVFGFTKMYLFKAKDKWSSLPHGKWFLADLVTGAKICKSKSRKNIQALIRKIAKEWELYRLVFACRIAHQNKHGFEDWGLVPLEFSDEFNALLVVAKMEGLTGNTTLKDIHASRNTTTASLAG